MPDNLTLSAAGIKSGFAFVLPLAELATLQAEGNDTRQRLPFTEGTLVGDWLIAGADNVLPATWIDHASDGAGVTTTTIYQYDNATGYIVRSCERIDTGQDSTIHPETGQAFIEAGAELVADALDAPSEGDGASELAAPAVDPVSWQACSTCKGAGSIVIIEHTAALRQAGYPYTVTGVCGSCLGAGGMLVDARAI